MHSAVSDIESVTQVPVPLDVTDYYAWYNAIAKSYISAKSSRICYINNEMYIIMCAK